MSDNATPPPDGQVPSDGLPPIINLADFLVDELPLPKPLVKGVFDVGGKMVLGSGSKSYKTWVVADLAASLASGKPWLGLETEKSRVLFLNFEIPAPFFQRRLKAVCDARGVEEEDRRNVEIWNLRGHGGQYKTLMLQIENRIKGRDFNLILADPAYKLYGNIKENEASALGEFFNAGEALATRGNIGLCMSAHFSKGNQSLKDAIDRVSGSGVWGRDPDTFIAMTPHRIVGAFTIDITVRNHPEVKAFVVRWKFPVMVPDPSLNPAELREPPKPSASRAPKYSVDDLFVLLETKGPFDTVQDFYEAAHGEGFVSKGDFKKLLVKLKAMAGVKVLKGRWAWAP
jgi:AAA domain